MQTMVSNEEVGSTGLSKVKRYGWGLGQLEALNKGCRIHIALREQG
jgi:hypothetical protein